MFKQILVLARFAPLAVRACKWLLTVTAGALTVWTVSLTAELQKYAPASYVLAALVGAVTMSMIMAFLAWGASATFRAIYFARITRPNDALNPLEVTFTQKRIKLDEFCDPVTRVIKGKTFVGCELVGPATIIFSGCNLMGLPIPIQSSACNFISIKDGIESHFRGIVIYNCTLQDCRFLLLTMLVDHATSDELDRQVSGIPWLTDRISQTLGGDAGGAVPARTPPLA